MKSFRLKIRCTRGRLASAFLQGVGLRGGTIVWHTHTQHNMYIYLCEFVCMCVVKLGTTGLGRETSLIYVFEVGMMPSVRVNDLPVIL